VKYVTQSHHIKLHIYCTLHKKHDTLHSCITLAYMDRSKSFHHLWPLDKLQQNLSHQILHILLHYLAKQNATFHFSTTTFTKIYSKFIKRYSYYLTHISITCFLLNSNCLSVVCFLSCSKTICELTVCTASVSMSPISAFWNLRHPHPFNWTQHPDLNPMNW